MSSVKTTKFLLAVLCMTTGLTTANTFAEDLLIIQERSKGVNLSGEDSNLSASESLSVAPKGRVWAVKQGAESSYNIICMNQSPEAVTLSQSDNSPWLQSASGQCAEKGANLYSCTNGAKQAAMMCRTQPIANQSGGSSITDMTAVALRSLDNSDEAFYRIANSVMEQHKLHFDLCQDMHGQHSQGGVSFVIQATGEVENVAVIENGEFKQL